MSRNRREHGRIISVETKTRGDALAEDVAAGVTAISVEDAGDFDEDGGWLLIGGQVVEFTECDDDTGVITLADPLAVAAEQGDPVQVWSELYEEVVDYQQALVELDGEYDNPDPVVAEVAEGVGSLPEGDRGKAGESCTLYRVSEDEWEVVAVGGRGRQSQGTRWEQDDFYALTAADITAGSATMPLSHRPNDEALTCYLAGVPQRPTEWAIDYNAQTLTIPLDGWEQAGDVIWVHYAYRKGVATSVINPTVTVEVPFSGVAGTSLTYQYGCSPVGAGQILADGSDATYINYSGGGGNFFSTHDPASRTVPPSGFKCEWWFKTNMAAGDSFNVYAEQVGSGIYGRWQYTAEPDATSAGGWLHAPMVLVDAAGLSSGLNAGTLRLQGELLGGGGTKVYEAKLVVSWDAA